MTFAEAPRDVVGEECGRPQPYAAGRLLPSFLPSSYYFYSYYSYYYYYYYYYSYCYYPYYDYCYLFYLIVSRQAGGPASELRLFDFLASACHQETG